MQFGRVGRMLAILFIVVLISGCLNASEGGGVQSNVTQTTSTSSLQLVFPDNVSFKAVLEVFQNGTLIANYSYVGEINYTLRSAMVRLSVVYNPENKHLTGNWHYKKILVENGSLVKIFNVPPASWSVVPKNQSAGIIEEIFSDNPYRSLFDALNGGGIPNAGNISVKLAVNQTVALLSPLMWGNQAPEIQMEGWVLVKGDKIVEAHLFGMSGMRKYVFNLEVVG